MSQRPPPSKYANIPGVQRLIRIVNATDAQVPVAIDEMDGLFNFIGIGKKLTSLVVVLESFVRAARLIPDCTQPEWFFAHDTISAYRRTAELILGHREKLSLILDLCPLDKEKNKSFHGLTTTFPLYTTIGYVASRSNFLKTHDLIKAQFFMAYAGLLEFGPPPNPVEALLVLRSLASEDEDLSRLPHRPLPFAEYVECLRPLTAIKGLSRLLKFFDEALHQVHGESFKSSLSWYEPDESTIKTTIVGPTKKTVEIVDQHAPHSVHSSDRIQLPSEIHIGITTDPKVSAIELKEQARRIATKRATQNQIFCFGWSELVQQDLKSLLDLIKTDGEEHDITTRVTLGLMLFYGFSFNRVSKLQYATSTTALENEDSYLTDVRRLRLHSPGPVYKTLLEDAALNQRETNKKYVDHDIPDFLADLIERRQKLPFLAGRDLHHRCRTFLSRCKNKSFHRLTPNRIQQHLQRTITRLSDGDSSSASLALGKDIYLARTRIHYAAFSQAILRNQHACASRTIDPSIQYALSDLPEHSGYIGTPIRPKLCTVQNLVGLVKQDIGFVRGGRFLTVNDLAGFHNRYTIYTLLMLGYATGYRAVTTPYVPQELRDHQSGACVVRDKDSANFSHSRLVWLPPACQNQLMFYDHHCNELLKLVSDKSPLGHRTQPIFFLDQTGVAIPVRPKEVVKQLRRFGYYLPPNAHRHFLKSHLQEIGCPAELVEYLLGHWHIGEEPWSDNSGLSPLTFRSQTLQYIVPLFKRLGLQPLPGLKKIPERLVTNITISIKENSGALSTKPPAAKLPIQQPGQFWYSLLPSHLRSKDPDDAFSVDQKVVLNKIHRVMPGLYEGEGGLTVTDEQLAELIRRVKYKRLPQTQLYKRLRFLAQGLEAGKQSLGWNVNPFTPPVHVSINRNRIRPSVLKRLNQFRQIEKFLMQDLERGPDEWEAFHKSMPEDFRIQPLMTAREIALGQILLSAVLYGGLHMEHCLPAFLKAVRQPYQYGTVLWVDLWFSEEPNILQERWIKQRNPDHYRRWVADPMTQVLIYRALQIPDWQKLDEGMSSEVLYSRYAGHFELAHGFTLPKFKRLIMFAKAWASCHLPPFLAAIAAGERPTSSLPDPAWLRIFTGLNYTVPAPKKTFSKRLFEEPLATQKKIIDALREGIHKSKTIEDAYQETDIYIQQHRDSMFSATRLLAGWAQRLLSEREYVEEHRNILLKKTRTVSDYLMKIVGPVLSVIGDRDVTIMDGNDVKSVVTKIVNEICMDRDEGYDELDEKKKNRIISTLERLRQFLSYLELFHQIPCPSIDTEIKSIKEGLDRGSVRANLITEGTFIRLKQSLLPQYPQRHHQLWLIVAILAFRAGLRAEEICGLLLSDLRDEDSLELLVKNNGWRDLKSEASKRRLPLYSLLPEDELNFLIRWREQRSKEPGSHKDKNTLLLTMNPAVNQACRRNEIIDPVSNILSQLTGDYTLTLHSLRHSFATWLLVRLLLWPHQDKRIVPIFLADHQMMPRERDRIRSLLLDNAQSGRKAIYAVSTLMGHAEPSTSLRYYVHLCDWLYSQYSYDPSCEPVFTTAALMKISGASKSQVNYYKRSEHHTLSTQIANNAPQFDMILEHPLVSAGNIPKKNNQQHNKSRFPAFSQLLGSIDAACQRKMSTAVVDILGELYERVVSSSIHPRSIAHAARLSLEMYKPHDQAFRFIEIEQAAKVLVLLQTIGIESYGRYYRSRWCKGSVEQIQKWQKTLLCHVGFATERSREKSRYGVVRIFPVRLVLKERRVGVNTKVLALLLNLLTLLSQIHAKRGSFKANKKLRVLDSEKMQTDRQSATL